MKTVSVKIFESVYKDFEDHARRTNRTLAELFGDVMKLFHKQNIRPRSSLKTLKPLDLGKTLHFKGDLRDEMLRHSR